MGWADDRCGIVSRGRAMRRKTTSEGKVVVLRRDRTGTGGCAESVGVRGDTVVADRVVGVGDAHDAGMRLTVPVDHGAGGMTTSEFRMIGVSWLAVNMVLLLPGMR